MPPFGLGFKARAQTSFTPGFNPDQLSPIRRWRSVTGITQSSGIVSSWLDTVAGYEMTPPGSAPNYVIADSQFGNKNVISTIDNVSAMVSVDNVDYGQYTIFIVAKDVSGGYLYTHNDGFEYFFSTTGDTSYTGVRGGSDNSSYNVPFSNWGVYPTPKIYTKRFDGTYTGDLLWVNGLPQTKSVVNAGDPGTDVLSEPVSIFGNLTPAFGAQGKYAELIIYDYVLTDGQRADVEQWLYNEYALATDKSVWLRADEGVSLGTGNNVTAWADTSSTQIEPSFTQDDGTTCPQLNASGMGGNPDFSFDGTQFLIGSGTVIGAGGVTLFGTFKTTNLGAMILWGMQYNNYQYAIEINALGGTGQITFTGLTGNACISTDSFYDGNPHAFIATYDATGTGNLTLYVDDFSTPQGTATAGYLTQIYNVSGDLNAVGTSHGPGSGDHDRPFIGNVGELGAFDWAIDAATVLSLGTYLKGRVGI